MPVPSALIATFERLRPVPASRGGSTSKAPATAAHAFVRRSRRATFTSPLFVKLAYAVPLSDIATDGAVPLPIGAGRLHGCPPSGRTAP